MSEDFVVLSMSAQRQFRIGVSTHKLKELQVSDSRSAYCKVGTDLVVYALGVVTGDIKGFDLAPEIGDAGQKFLALLQTTSTRDQDDTLQLLLFALFN